MEHAVSTGREVAVVTGAASGIGAATARRFAEEGTAVMLIDRSPAVQEVRDDLLGLAPVAAQVMDVSDEGAWTELSARCRDELGAPRILVSNAYTVDVAPLERTSAESWERQLRVNLTGAFLATRVLLEDLLAGGDGAIVLISSVHAHFGLPGRAAYASTKAALTGLARQLAAEYGPRLRANSVLPGPVLTGAWDELGEQERRASAAATALGRLGDPSEVAEAITFLCSSRASFITGTELTVDGGWSITKESS